MSSTQEPVILGIVAVQRLFEAACAVFQHALNASDDAADAIDFTGHMHNLSLAAGRVQALGEALVLLTGDQSWNQRAAEALRGYLDAGSSES